MQPGTPAEDAPLVWDEAAKSFVEAATPPQPPPPPAAAAETKPDAPAAPDTKPAAEDHCVVCDEPLGTRRAAALPCGHRFHADCVGEWLGRRRNLDPNCPLCRAPVPAARAANLAAAERSAAREAAAARERARTEAAQLAAEEARLRRAAADAVLALRAARARHKEQRKRGHEAVEQAAAQLDMLAKARRVQ